METSSSNLGECSKCILKTSWSVPKYLSDMEKLGYFTTYKILNAMDFGIPQNEKSICY